MVATLSFVFTLDLYRNKTERIRTNPDLLVLNKRDFIVAGFQDAPDFQAWHQFLVKCEATQCIFCPAYEYLLADASHGDLMKHLHRRYLRHRPDGQPFACPHFSAMWLWMAQCICRIMQRWSTISSTDLSGCGSSLGGLPKMVSVTSWKRCWSGSPVPPAPRPIAVPSSTIAISYHTEFLTSTLRGNCSIHSYHDLSTSPVVSYFIWLKITISSRSHSNQGSISLYSME